jgi:hypothetical protein
MRCREVEVSRDGTGSLFAWGEEGTETHFRSGVAGSKVLPMKRMGHCRLAAIGPNYKNS